MAARCDCKVILTSPVQAEWTMAAAKTADARIPKFAFSSLIFARCRSSLLGTSLAFVPRTTRGTWVHHHERTTVFLFLDRGFLLFRFYRHCQRIVRASAFTAAAV
jgi:hypothetical protein